MKAAIRTIDAWVKADIENQSLPQSVWQDVAAVQGRCLQGRLPRTMVLKQRLCFVVLFVSV